MKNNVKTILTFIFGWPLSIFALYFIGKNFMPSFDRLQAISLQPFPLVIGIVCFLIYFFMRSLLWYKILRNMDHEIALHDALFLWQINELKRYVPGNIWSFLGKTIAFNELGVPKRHVARAIAIELQVVFLGAVLASMPSAFFVGKYFSPLLSIVSVEIMSIVSFIIFLSYIYHKKYVMFLPEKIKQPLHLFLPDFTPKQLTLLLSIAISGFFFLGLGYFFTIFSLTFLHPQDVYVLSSFFILSFLVGLLSFITPSGLGVREGLMTIGLTKIMSVSMAGFSALFGRILLTITELIFTLFTLIYRKMSLQKIVPFQAFLLKHVSEIMLAIFTTLFIIYFVTASFLRHDNFMTGRFDLGNMDQTVWNTAHGRIFQLTDPDSTQIVSRIAVHADFILVAFAPLYWLWEDPKVLLLTQTIIMATGAIFVYLLAVRIIKNKKTGLFLSLAYLMNPSLQWSILYDFHAVTLATTFLLAAFYFLYERKWLLFFFFSLLAGTTKEHIWFITALLGLTAFLSEYFNTKKIVVILFARKQPNPQKKYLPGLFLFVISFFASYYLIWQAIPAASQSSQHIALSYFTSTPENPTAIVKEILTNPQITLEKITSESRKLYIKKLLLPIGYLPILAPWFLFFPSADFVLNLLSDKYHLHQIYYQYTAAITPFLFIAAVFAIAYAKKVFPQLSTTFIGVYLICMSVYGNMLYGPLPGTKEQNIGMFTANVPEKEGIRSFLRSIDKSYKIAASNEMGAQLSQREYIFTFPNGVDVADMLIFYHTETKWEKEKITELRKNNSYKVLYETETFIAFQKE